MQKFFWLIGLTCFSWAPGAAATSLLKLELPQLAQRADAVIVGTVMARSARHDASLGIIVTDNTIAVDHVVAGSAPAQLTVVTYGGRLGEIRQVVSGAAAFELNEQVAVFVAASPAGNLHVVAMAEGKLRVIHEHDQAMVVRAGGLPVVDPERGTFVPLEPLRLELAAFEEQVRAARSQ